MNDDPPSVRANRARPPMRDVRVSRDGVRVPLALARVEQVATHVLRWERCTRPVAIGITFVSDRAIARLNRTHLGHDGATDIVTFEHAPGGEWAPIVGDIYIAPGVARKNARRFGSPVREELARLAIHGVLHAIGWEHPDGEGREQSEMWRRQERWLRRARAGGLLP